MKEKRIFLVVTLLFSLLMMTMINISAVASQIGQAEAVAWIQARENESWSQDYDHTGGYPQCVDLIKYYADFLDPSWKPTGNGYDYVSRSDLPSGWTYQSEPHPGDIAVWGKNKGIARDNGHVALVKEVFSNGTFYYVDVNGKTGLAGAGTISNSDPSTFIHPNFDTIPPSISSCVEVTNVSRNGFTLTYSADDNVGVTSVWADVRPGSHEATPQTVYGVYNKSTKKATINIDTADIAARSGSSSQNYYVTCNARDAAGYSAKVDVKHERITVYPVEINSTGLNKTTGTFKTTQDTAGHYEPCEEIDGKPTETFCYAKGASVSGVGIYTNQWGATYLLTANGDWLYADHVRYQMQWSDIWDTISSFFNGKVTKIVYFAGQPMESVENTNQAKAPAGLLAASNTSSIKLYGNVVTSANNSGTYSVPSYQVYFDANGGSVSASNKTVFQNSTYGTLPTPYRLGYSFDGWFTAVEGGSLVSDSAPISNSNHTLYAHWTRIVLLQGSCGADLSFILYGDGEMIVTGSGAMTSHPWTDNAYSQRVVDVSLPQGMTSLCSSAFQNCTYLQTINLPNVETIPYACFYNCSYLETVDLPSVLWAIDYEAFRNCTSLSSIDIPDSVLYIGGCAFSGCSSLSSVRLSENLKELSGRINSADERTWNSHSRTDYSYGYGAFKNCTALKEIVIPKRLTSAYQAFIGCTNLCKVTLEEGMTTVASGLFYSCPGITEITIPVDVTTIQSDAFREAKNLKKVTMGNAVTSIENSAFYHCDSLESINLSKGLQTLGYDVFNYCVSLPTINIPRTLNSVNTPFQYCSALKTVTFESGVDRIADYLFYNCTGLQTVTLPSTLQVIGHNAFYNCTGLETVALPSALWAIDYEAFRNCTSLTSIDIPDSVLYIGGCAFSGCSSLSSVRLSENLKELSGRINSADERTWNSYSRTDYSYGYGAFKNCTALKEIVIPGSVIRVPNESFSGCSQLQAVTFKGTDTSICDSCFSGCKMLTDVSLPAALKEIPSYCFYNCDSLVCITLPDTVKTIKSHAFDDCNILKEMVFNSALQTIEEYAFNKCDSLETVELQAGVTSLRQYAFYSCPKLATLVLPQTLQSIGAYCFAYDAGLMSVTIPDSVTSLGERAFYQCDGLKNLTFGTGLTSIPQYCFYSNTSLEEVIIPYRVTTINAYAFANCTKLLKLTIPRSVTNIGTNAFSYVDRMTVYGVSGTYAETWAKNSGFEFIDNPIHVETVELIPSELTIIKGGTHTVALAVNPDNFTDEVSWKSSNESIATINDSGLVTAKALGTCFIKVIVGNKSATCNITVVQPVTSISLSMSSKTLEAFETVELKATVNPTTANIKDVAWSISNPEVATMEDIGIDANGRPGVRITALTAGTSIITCKATDGSEKFATCTITVSNVGHVVEDISEFESAHNYSNNSNEVWQYTYSGETEQLYVSFDNRTILEDGFDSLIVYAGSTKVGEYTGTALRGQTIIVPGNVVRIRLKSDGSGNDWGFKVTRVSPTEAETLEDFTVTLPADMGCKITISAPDGGWVIGENIFTVECDNACVLLVTDDGGKTYTRLEATAAESDYAFTVDLTVNSSIVCAVKGDISGDGELSALEARQILMAGNGMFELTPLQRLIADANGDGELSALEARQILMAGNGMFDIEW